MAVRMRTKLEEVHTGDRCNKQQRKQPARAFTHTRAEEVGQTAATSSCPDNNTRNRDTMESTTNIWTNTLYLIHKLTLTSTHIKSGSKHKPETSQSCHHVNTDWR